MQLKRQRIGKHPETPESASADKTTPGSRPMTPAHLSTRPDSYVKVFVSMIRKFSPLIPERRKGPVFLEPWAGLSFTKVEVHGVVVSEHAVGGDGGRSLTIDDGTGRISAMIWFKDQPSTSLVGKQLGVQGNLLAFRDTIQVRVDTLIPEDDADEPIEECIWWLSVKEEFESLVASSRKSLGGDFCPCMCHVSNGVCFCIGSIKDWSPSFVRAVAVVSAGLPSALPVARLIELASQSPSLHGCLAHCATVQAIKLQRPEPREVAQEQCVFPETPFISQASQVERKNVKSNFFSASQFVIKK